MDDSHKDNSVLDRIKQTYPTLSKSQKQLANYISQNAAEVVKQTISELLTHTNYKSEASIVSFYQVLGYKSFKEFKLILTQELASRTFYHSETDITFDDSAGDIKSKVFMGAVNTLLKNASNQIEECITAQQLLYEASKVIIIGHGASSALCQYAYFRLTEVGVRCVYNLDAHFNVALLANANETDVVLCISQSGETADVYKQVNLAAGKGLKVVLITGSEQSSLAKLSYCVLSIESEEVKSLTDSMNSRIAQFCLIDALFTMISIRYAKHTIKQLHETRNAFKTYKLID